MLADANRSYNFEPGALPTASRRGNITGEVSGLPAFRAPFTGYLYSAEIYSFKFHLPLYFDD